jgi:hypothetical protein
VNEYGYISNGGVQELQMRSEFRIIQYNGCQKTLVLYFCFYAHATGRHAKVANSLRKECVGGFIHWI